jgi:hypothetical protein
VFIDGGRIMKLAAIAMVLSIAVTVGCAASPPASTLRIESGKTIGLRAGESALTVDSQLRIGFDTVISDSRCPKAVQCVWSGDAIARIWIQRGAGPKEFHELHSAAGRPNSAGGVRLIGLEPYPVAGTSIAKNDYVLTLTLGPDISTAPDR